MAFRRFCGIAALVILAVPGSLAVAADNSVEREVQDRAQIEKLMWQYVRALDKEDPEAYAAVYTPNGQFGSGANAVKGREAIKKMINDLRQRAADNESKTGEKRPPMYHVITNSYVEFVDKDHAHMEAYWMTVFGGGPQKATPRVAAVGREIDELVRVNGHWLIDTRDVAPKD